MGTRQEDFNAIRTLYDALSYQEDLKKRIEEEKEKIEWQQSRKIEDFPAYEPPNFKKKAERERKNKHEEEKESRVFAIGLIFKLLAIAFVIYRLVSGAFVINDDDWDMMFWVIVFWGIAAFATLGIIAPIEQNKISEKVSIFTRLGILCAVDIVVGLLFMLIGSADTTSEGVADEGALWLFWSETSFAGAVAAGCTLAVGWLTCLILSRTAREKQNQAIAKAEREDAEHLAEYKRNKAAGEIVIARQRAALATEVTSKIAEMRARIATYLQEMQKQQQIVAQTPGLAREDKNLYTVSTILRYFERGKVDSIKEAVNLFDAEERQKAAARESARAAAERTIAINNWIKTQQDAMEEMEANQRRHNERIEDEARRARERIEDELDRLNR